MSRDKVRKWIKKAATQTKHRKKQKVATNNYNMQRAFGNILDQQSAATPPIEVYVGDINNFGSTRESWSSLITTGGAAGDRCTKNIHLAKKV